MSIEPGPALRLRAKQRHGATRGHPWVYGNELESRPEDLSPGQSCALHDARGRFIAHGLVSPESNIVWRRYSTQKADAVLNDTLMESLILDAIQRRDGDPFCRLVWSDADSLPGLIIDRFGSVAVVQSVTAAMDLRLDAIASILERSIELSEIVFRCDAPIRSHEGVENFVRTQSGQSLKPDWYQIDGLDYLLDLQEGQKTGFYLDQRSQHRRAGSLAKGRRVLDLCCNQGAFALHCTRAGASEVLAVDISDACIAATLANAQRNGLEIETQAANAFDFFSENKGQQWDMIILDPPSFAKNRKSVGSALKGYKELNLRAIQSLAPGGILATYSCSHHIGQTAFFATVGEAAADARRQLRLVETASQPADHPVLLNFPESQYLKGFWLELR